MQGFELPTDNKLDDPPQMLPRHLFGAPIPTFFEDVCCHQIQNETIFYETEMSVWASDMSLMFYSE